MMCICRGAWIPPDAATACQTVGAHRSAAEKSASAGDELPVKGRIMSAEHSNRPVCSDSAVPEKKGCLLSATRSVPYRLLYDVINALVVVLPGHPAPRRNDLPHSRDAKFLLYFLDVRLPPHFHVGIGGIEDRAFELVGLHLPGQRIREPKSKTNRLCPPLLALSLADFGPQPETRMMECCHAVLCGSLSPGLAFREKLKSACVVRDRLNWGTPGGARAHTPARRKGVR